MADAEATIEALISVASPLLASPLREGVWRHTRRDRGGLSGAEEGGRS
jgi:hypothetical protein